MIQRIQSIYLLLVMILLSIVTFGTEIFSFLSDDTSYVFSSYGVHAYDLNSGTLSTSNSYPFFLSLSGLILLAFLTLMSYKNLNRQLKLARITFYIYLLLVIALLIFSAVGGKFVAEGIVKRELGLGYFLFIAGLPFAFLANIGIKRDKNLIDSLNRLR
jgi:amino acid transporter